MKASTLFTLSLLLLIGISACQKTKDDINELTEFDLNYSTDFTIPAASFTSVTQPVDIITPEILTNSSSTYSDNGTSKDHINEVKLTRFNLSTTSANLDFLRSVSFFIRNPIGDVLVAKKDSIPLGTTFILADLENVNIKDELSKDKIQLRMSVLFRTGSSNNQNLKIEQTTHVKATLIK